MQMTEKCEAIRALLVEHFLECMREDGGDYRSQQYLERATARLKIVIPVTLLIIFLLYLNFRSRWSEGSG
jgi:hypothetical protein